MPNPFYVFIKKELIFLLALFILGLIVGAALLNLYISQRIDQLILKKNELEVQVEEQQEQINKLKENLHKQHFINKLTIKLETDVNQHSQQEIAKTIHKLLASLLGKEIEQIDPLLLRDIINEAYILVEDHTYQLKLIYLVITEELKLYIKVITTIKNTEAE